MTWIQKLIMNQVVGRLDGYKTIIGGVGSILYGIAMIIGFYWPDSGLPAPDNLDAAIAFIIGGWTALGIGHKMDKAKVTYDIR